jgi:iron complex transport system substrate-binding protein
LKFSQQKNSKGGDIMSLKRTAAFFLMFLLIFLTATSCTDVKADKGDIKQEDREFSFKDDSGRVVRISIPVESVVSLAPSHTEIVFALGAQDKLKGVTSFCNYPREAEKIDKVGDFFNPNLELIISKKPDIVLAVKGVQESVIASLEKNGIAVAIFDATSLEDTARDIEIIGKILGREKKADSIARNIRDASKRYKSTGKTVFLEINSQPLITAGKNTFISAAIKAAGGLNAGDLIGEEYPMVNPEKLIEIDPDVYLISKSLGVSPEDVKKRPGFSRLECVREGKIYVLPDDDIIQRPGPRIVEGIEMINEIINK